MTLQIILTVYSEQKLLELYTPFAHVGAMLRSRSHTHCKRQNKKVLSLYLELI